jgi:hypothetical protein
VKKSFFIVLGISLIIGSCTHQEVKSPIEGAWNLISGDETSPDTTIHYQRSTNSHYMKIIGEKYFSTTWQDTTRDKSDFYYSGFNGGTYTFVNGVYTETLKCFSNPAYIGRKLAFKTEIKNDTLVITYIPEKSTEGLSFVEKWKRLD